MKMTGRKTRVGITLTVAFLALPGPTYAQVGTVIGTVFDSINGGPLVDAAVFLWDTPHRGVSDSEGRFRIEGVPPGDYNILFFHTKLGELGVSPGARSVAVQADAEAAIALATPSMSTVVLSQCLMEEREPGSGALAGRITDGSSELALSGATVTLSWHEADALSATKINLRTGGDGWYRSCDVPADMPVLVTSDFLNRKAPRREVRVERDGFTEADFSLYTLSSTTVSGQLVDGDTDDPVEGAEAWLRGTDHRALSDGDGRFGFGEVPPGTYMLMTDHLAYGTKMDTLEVPAGQLLTVEMRLDTRPVPIAPVSVTVDAAPVEIARRRGGIVITREQIEQVRQRSRDASDVLRSLHIPGVIVRHQSNGVICVGYSTGQVKMNQTGCVEMMIYINNVRATDSDLALRLPPDAIERMVIYKPVEAGNLFGLGGGNGVWMIYTKGN